LALQEALGGEQNLEDSTFSYNQVGIPKEMDLDENYGRTVIIETDIEDNSPSARIQDAEPKHYQHPSGSS
jgi:hypothetical protein